MLAGAGVDLEGGLGGLGTTEEPSSLPGNLPEEMSLPKLSFLALSLSLSLSLSSFLPSSATDSVLY